MSDDERISLEKYLGARIEDLRTYLNRRIDDEVARQEQRYQHMLREQASKETSLKEGLSSTFSATQEAITKAESANERRFDSVNEFRQAMLDQASHYVTRAEFEAKHESLGARITRNDGRLDKIEGAGAGRGQFFGWAVAVVSTLALIASVVIQVHYSHP